MIPNLIDGELFFGPKLLTAREAIEQLNADAGALSGSIDELRHAEFIAQRKLETAAVDGEPLADYRRTVAQIRHELDEIERERNELLFAAKRVADAEVAHIARQIAAAEREAIAALTRPFETILKETAL